jgi:uncharacterized protein YjaZ
MKNILTILLIILFFACKQSASQPANPTPYSIGGGNKVVFLGDYYTDYLNAVKAGSKNKDSLYGNKIQGPIISNYFSSCEYSRLVGFQFYSPIQDTTGIRDRISIIYNNREKIEKIIAATLKDCNKYLKNDTLTIYIQPFPGGYMSKIIKRMNGIAGITAGSKQIMMTIDPEVNSWSDVLAASLAHEYNHAYWTKMNYKNLHNWNLLSYLIFEGRADSYSHIIYPDRIAPWDTALSVNEKSDLWIKLKPKLQEVDPGFQRGVMFGSKEYPIWGGYALGYAIVQSALKNNPKLTPEEWTNLDPEKILEMSDYK